MTASLEEGAKRNSPTKLRIYLSILFALLMLVILIVFILLLIPRQGKTKRLKYENETFEDNGVCHTEECEKLGHRMKTLMNESVNPCEDFYENACGNYPKKTMEEVFQHANEDLKNLNIFLTKYQPKTLSERVALTVWLKCLNSSEDNNTTDDSIWKSNDLTKLILEVVKINPHNSGIIKNQIEMEKWNKTMILISRMEKAGRKSQSTSEIQIQDIKNVTFMNLTEYLEGLIHEENRDEAFNGINYVDVQDLMELEEEIKRDGVEKTKNILHEKWKEKLTKFLVEPKFCYNIVLDLFPGTLATIFTKNLLEPYALRNAEKLFEKLRNEFINVFKENEWLNDDMKNRLIEELKQIKTSIGIPDEHKNQKNIDRMYARIEKNETIEDQSYLTLIRNILKMNSEETFLRVARREKITYIGNAIKFETNYLPESHRITLSTNVLKYPYIDDNLPEWNTYASFGYILGHEIGHAFDSQHFFKDVDFGEFQMPATIRDIFNKRMDCIIDKYDKFQFPDGSFSSGSRTKIEDTADMIGFQLAYRLSKKVMQLSEKLPGFEKYTIQQNYFHRMAYNWCAGFMNERVIEYYNKDIHSAMKFRINGMFSNSPEFSKAFKCPKNSPMNPEKKSIIALLYSNYMGWIDEKQNPEKNKNICRTEECVKLGNRMRSLMNKSVNPCDDFYENSCGNFPNDQKTEILQLMDEDVKMMEDLMINYKPQTYPERIAMTVWKKCAASSKDKNNIDMSIWKSNDLTKLILEVVKVSPNNASFIKNEIKMIKWYGKMLLMFKLEKGKEENKTNVGGFKLSPFELLKVKNITFMNLTEYIEGLVPEEYQNEAFNGLSFGDYYHLRDLEKEIQEDGIENAKQLLFDKWKSTLDAYLVEPEDCYQKITELFPGTLATIFARKFIGSKTLERANMLFEELQEEFTNIFKENDFLDEHLKTLLIEELRQMKASLGIPDEHKNQTNIDRMYARIEKNEKIEEQSYLTLIRNILKMNSEETFLRIARREQITYLGETIKLTAHYVPRAHRITLSTNLLNFPYIDKNLPEWNTYAALGFIFGHEIGHSFDSTAFFKNILSEQIKMSPKIRQIFNERVDCIVQKYDKFQFPDGSFSSGSRTKTEDTADMIGFQLAHRLFKKSLKNAQKLPGFEKYSIQQNYFHRMAYVWCGGELTEKDIKKYHGDIHSAFKFRVNGMMSNSPEFSKAFNCPKNSPMNPEKKCPFFK
ncbi:unnamed protein product [Caenorhabditis angaria]|uniref:Peptidase M13 C-terminal domain-containing protein n=1 Tax=Caenorhabditis angaria TaxID=860376 RepID=A0A9P1I3G1_9PELO|nr:unnamed protein product [Caenorhabditis angaria]